MKRLKSIEPKVETALRNNPKARKDDFILILDVYKNYGVAAMPLNEVLINHKEYNLPSFASIIRIRRQLQCADPSLCDADTVEKRAEAEADYVDYAREG